MIKRQNLLAVFILVVAVSACALLVGLGDGEADALGFQPFGDFGTGDAH